MSRVLDPLRVKQYKDLRLKGYNKSDALKSIGYSNTSAEHHQSDLGVVKRGEKEIMEELSRLGYSKEDIEKRFDIGIKMAMSKKDITNYFRGNEDLARMQGLFTDKIEQTNITQEDKSAIDRLMGRIPTG